MYLGIDVGGTKIQGAYFEQEMVRLTPQTSTPTNDYAEFRDALMRMVEETTHACGQQISKLGIGVPGTATEESVTWVPNLPFLNGRDLAGDLRSLLGTDVVIANDAQLALLGEIWQGAAREPQNVVLLSIGTGVGGAIMQNGKIVRGAHGSAGAFGWLNLDWSAASDPEHGYVELHAAGSALERQARQLPEPISSYELMSRARGGDPTCQAIVLRFGNLLGVACASIASILDPEMMVIAGGLADEFDLFEGSLRSALQLYGSPSVRAVPVISARLGKHAAAYGALRAAMLQQAIWR